MSPPRTERHIDVVEVVRTTTVQAAHDSHSEMGRQLQAKALNSTGAGSKRVNGTVSCRSSTSLVYVRHLTVLFLRVKRVMPACRKQAYRSGPAVRRSPSKQRV